MSVEKCPKCGHGLVIRSVEQNAKLHALLQDIAQQLEWAGEYRDIETWKRMMVAAFERANANAPVMLPALDGAGVDFIYRRTHRMSKQELSELIEFATSWALEHGVALSMEQMAA